MKINVKILIIVALFILFQTAGFSQVNFSNSEIEQAKTMIQEANDQFLSTNNAPYYYYKNQRKYLKLNRRTIGIEFRDEAIAKSFMESSENSNKTFTKIKEDKTRAGVKVISNTAKSRQNLKTFYLETTLLNELEIQAFFKQIESYNRLPGVILASPTYSVIGTDQLGLSSNFYVKLKHADDLVQLNKMAELYGLEVLGQDQFMPLWYTLHCPKTVQSNALVLSVLFFETGVFEKSEPAFKYHNLELTNDPLYNTQWAMENTGQNGGIPGIDINAEAAWTITKGDGVNLAVFDHGFERDHPDLAGNNVGTGFDGNNMSSPATVKGPHGTACAGIAGAVSDNNEGISGVASEAGLISISLNLQFSDTPQQLASGFNWAWANNTDVISNSWGGYAPSSILDDAITNALTLGRGGKGTVIVFAAGNEDNQNIRYPGNSNPDIIVVGAMSPCGQRKSPTSCDGENWGSCFGNQLDVVAPGVLMQTTDRQGASGYHHTDYDPAFNGTSSACPAVAGVAALVLSVNSNLTVQDVNDIIESTAQKTRADLYGYSTTTGRPNGTWHLEMGYGLVDAFAAVQTAIAYSCPTDLNLTGSETTAISYQAANSITSIQTIESTADVDYIAGNSITILPGFLAKSGSVFETTVGVFCKTSKKDKRTTINPDQSTFTFDTPLRALDNEVDSNMKVSVIPNPFQTLTKLTFQLEQETEVSISVYDMTGRQIKQLTDGRLESGAHEIVWETDNQPPGVYLAKLVYNGKIQTVKMILAK